MKEYDDNLLFNEQELEDWSTFQKIEEKPFTGFNPKPLPDDDPGLLKAIEDAKNKFIKNYLQSKESERQSNKNKYTLYKNALDLIQKANGYDSVINNYEKNLKEANGDKDKLEFVNAQYKTALELRNKINNNELAEARSIVDIHDFEVANSAKEANEKAKIVVEQTKKAYLKKRFDQLNAIARKNYEDTLKINVDARDELEIKSSKIWSNQLLKDRNDQRIKIDEYISDDAKNHYNKNLKEAIDKVKKAPLEDLYKLNLFGRRYNSALRINELTDRDLRDAEQVFDRMFMDLHALQGKYNPQEGILPKIKFKGKTFEFFELDEKDIKELGDDARLYDVTDKLLKKAGVDVKEVDARKYEQYAKALFLYSVGHQTLQFEYAPKYFERTDKGLEFKDADNNPEYSINTNKIILNEASEEREEYKNRNHIKTSDYQRIRYDEMISIYTKQKNLIDTVVPVKEEPKIEEPENKGPEINVEDNNINNINNEENNIINDNNENNIKMPDLSEEHINAKVEEFLQAHQGDLNISAMEAYIQAINSLGNNYDVFDNPMAEAFQAYGLATAEAKNGGYVKNYPGGTRIIFNGVEAVRRAYAKAFVMAEELDEAFRQYHIQLERNGIDDQVNEDLRIMAHDIYDIMSDPAYEDVLKTDSSYHMSLASMLATYPYNRFKQDDGTFKTDPQRYAAMLERIPFFKQMRDRNAHIKDNYLTYQSMRADGDVKDIEITRYRQAYIQNLENTKKNFETIRAVSEEDPDIKSLQPFEANTNQNFYKNWAADRLGNLVMQRTDIQLAALDRGWPVEDAGFVLEMILVERDLRDMAAGKGETNEQQAQKAKLILKSMESSLDKVKNSVITSAEVREDILDALDAPIKEYVELRKEVPIAQGVSYGTPAIEKVHKMARLREVRPAEYENEFRVSVENGVKKPTITFDQIKENIRIMLDDLHSVELWKGSGEFKKMKNSLTNLKEYADERMGVIDPEKPVEEEMLRNLRELKTKLLDTTEKTRKYLDHKGEDFAKDGTRRERDGKQTAEQSRIKMAINQLENLTFLTDMVDAYENEVSPMTKFIENDLPAYKDAAKQRLEQKIAKENDNLKNAQTADQYIQALGRVILYDLQKKDIYYKPFGKENLEQFRNRIEQTGTRDINRKDIQAMLDKDSTFNEFMKEHYEKFSQPGYKRLATNVARAMYLLKVNQKKSEKKEEDEKDEKIELKEGSREINRYKRILVSDKRKQKRQENQNQKKQDREQEAARLNRKL